MGSQRSGSRRHPHPGENGIRCSLLVLVAAAVWPCAILDAQQAGDAVTFDRWNSATHLVALSAPGGAVKTLATLTGSRFTGGLAVATANHGVVFSEISLTTSRVHILHFKPGRGVTTLAVLPASFVRLPTLDVDQGGDVLILNHSGPDRGLYRMPAWGGPLSTIAHVKTGALFAVPYCMAEDLSTGDFIVPDANGLIHRVTPAGQTSPVPYSFPLPIPGNPVGNLHVDQSTGLMFLAVGYHLVGLDPATGATIVRMGVSSAFLSEFLGFDGDPFRGGYYVHTRNIRFPAKGVLRFNPGNNSLTPFGGFWPGIWGNVVTWGSRMVGGFGRPIRGRAYPVALAFLGESGKSYLAAASLGTLQGIPVGGSRRIPLDPDALFYASIRAPAIFQNFQGGLNAQGRANLTVNIPANPRLRGLRFFLAAITYDGSGIRVISDPLGVTVE